MILDRGVRQPKWAWDKKAATIRWKHSLMPNRVLFDSKQTGRRGHPTAGHPPLARPAFLLVEAPQHGNSKPLVSDLLLANAFQIAAVAAEWRLIE
jgi:hypothetical protein